MIVAFYYKQPQFEALSHPAGTTVPEYNKKPFILLDAKKSVRPSAGP
jgi:hypothetical protein